jgi:putative addiction module component (TIGR02574 family)
MGSKAAAIMKEVMTLSDAERATLVNELLAAMEPGKDEDVDQAWAMEIDRRGAELEQGVVTPVAWEEVRKKALRLAHAD